MNVCCVHPVLSKLQQRSSSVSVAVPAGTGCSLSGPPVLMSEKYKKGHRLGRGSALAGTGWNVVPTQNAWKRPEPALSEQDDKAAKADAEEQDRIDEWGIEALQNAEAAGGWDNPRSQDLDDEWPMPGGGDTTESAAGASDSPWDAPPGADSHWDLPSRKPVAPSEPMASNFGGPKALESASEEGEGNSASPNICRLCSGGTGCLTSVKD